MNAQFFQEAARYETWDHTNLARFAADQHIRIKQLQEANEQLRNDLRDAVRLVRENIITSNKP